MGRFPDAGIDGLGSASVDRIDERLPSKRGCIRGLKNLLLARVPMMETPRLSVAIDGPRQLDGSLLLTAENGLCIMEAAIRNWRKGCYSGALSMLIFGLSSF
jgi:hypothetical protein